MSIHVWRGVWNAVKKRIISLSWYISGPWPRDWNPCSMAHTELKRKLPTKGKKYSWKCQTFPSINVSAFIPFVLRHIIHGERSLTYDSWSTVEVWDECGVWSVQVEQEGVSQGKCQFSVMNEQQKFRPSPWEPTAPDTRSNSQHLLSFNGTHSHYSPPDKGRRPRIRLR